MRSAEEILDKYSSPLDRWMPRNNALLAMIEYASQLREPSTQGGEEKIFMEPESTYSLMTSSDPEKVEKGKVLRVQELALQLVKKNKRIQVLEEALRSAIADVNWMTNNGAVLNRSAFNYLDKALNPKD